VPYRLRWHHGAEAARCCECMIRPGPPADCGGGVSGLACRSPEPTRSIREEAADVHCGSGSWGCRCPSLADYVIGTGATRGATAAGQC
jgi:hypothetical protein